MQLVPGLENAATRHEELKRVVKGSVYSTMTMKNAATPRPCKLQLSTSELQAGALKIHSELPRVLETAATRHEELLRIVKGSVYPAMTAKMQPLPGLETAAQHLGAASERLEDPQ